MREKYPKFFGTMAYPYMNGTLHLGHAFTMTKVEFATGYERMNGKRALFPLGFHCTGMPIKTCADKLKKELEQFGPNFDLPLEEETNSLEISSSAVTPVSEDPAKFVAKKGKQASKKTNTSYQFQIMELIGVPDDEIAEFANSQYWLKYFPPIAKEDATSFGARIDWRRSFITTDANPYYDSFIRWQMNKLYALSKIKFGERYTIYSPRDKQPCMDHDRSSGEGVGPQDYTGIKMQVLEWSEAAKNQLSKFESDISGKKVFLIAATLRPETMYGQTNCFVGPNIQYIIVKSRDPKELYLCTERSAKNMAFQHLTSGDGQVETICEIKGSNIIGSQVHAPLSKYSKVYVLPMESVLSTKGTGVVTSVPSDSPDDWATTADLAKKADYYKISANWVKPAFAIISTPNYGDMCAETLVKEMKIQSPKDAKQLALAKEAAYKEGFYKGTMMVGLYKGEKVENAKPKVRQDLIDQHLAFVYQEPENLIISRSGEECVVALMDQWYIDYGEREWRNLTEVCLNRVNCFASETRNGFTRELDRIHQWACARQFGLGSRLPWDKSCLVESLSDSTIYMAYYTICHHLHSNIDGSAIGPAGIKHEEMTDPVWEYIFARGPKPETKIPAATLASLKREFEYFYPLDLRVSGKDLIGNHLTFFLYNHTALFSPEFWPKGIRANGHLMLNSEKMAKSTGNFLTLREAISKFGADATRIALADAGDFIEDANFEEETANAAILRLHTLLEWVQEMIRDKNTLRVGKENIHDRIFENEMNRLIGLTKESYEKAFYKNALQFGFHVFQNTFADYRKMTEDSGMQKDLVFKFLETLVLLITPIAPHFAEHIWTNLLEKPSSVQNIAFPMAGPVDSTLVAQNEYMRTLEGSVNAALGAQEKKKKKGKEVNFDPKKAKKLTIFNATELPKWQTSAIEILEQHYMENGETIHDAEIKKALISSGLLKDKKVMPFVQTFRTKINQLGSEAFKLKLPFDEDELLNIMVPFLQKSINAQSVAIVNAGFAVDKIEGATMAKDAVPGHPTFLFENVD